MIAAPSVTVAVLTFHRNEMLAALLPELRAQVAALARSGEILVVDNDPAAGARPVGEAAGPPVRYVHEPRRGLAAGRNRALDECSTDVLVFLDDDELPSSDWLAGLVAAWTEWRCAAVAGPVLPRFATEPSPWVRGTGVFDRTRPADGARLRSRGAGNLLLDMTALRVSGARFDERFGLTGGEDTMFTRSLTRSGAELRWCDSAEVVEVVPADRVSRRWALRRAFRAATTWAAVELAVVDGPLRRSALRLELLARAGLDLGRGAGGLVLGALHREPRRIGAGTAAVVRSGGLALGAFGLRPHGYGG